MRENQRSGRWTTSGAACLSMIGAGCTHAPPPTPDVVLEPAAPVASASAAPSPVTATAAVEPSEADVRAILARFPDASAATLSEAPTVPSTRQPKPKGAWLRIDGAADSGLPVRTLTAISNDDASLWPCEPKARVAGPGPLGFTLRFLARPGQDQREVETRAMPGVPASVVKCAKDLFVSRPIETEKLAAVVVFVQLVPSP